MFKPQLLRLSPQHPHPIPDLNILPVLGVSPFTYLNALCYPAFTFVYFVFYFSVY